MVSWFNAVVADVSKVSDAIAYFNKQIDEGVKEIPFNESIEKASANLPGQIQHRFNQLQEVEAILEHLHIAQRKERAKTLRKFMEHYNRELSAREAEKWIDGEEDIVVLQELINEVALVRNKYLGIMKGLDTKAFQVNNIVKLRVAGLEDAEIGRF